MPIFAIGDVHGCAEELLELLERIPRDDDATVVMLGDYIDRGPSSRRVLEILMEEKKRRRMVCLAGNHEEMMREFLDGSDEILARAMDRGGNVPQAAMGFYAEDGTGATVNRKLVVGHSGTITLRGDTQPFVLVLLDGGNA
jgi:predicted MPP superfamily phosphohydrolase